MATIPDEKVRGTLSAAHQTFSRIHDELSPGSGTPISDWDEVLWLPSSHGPQTVYNCERSIIAFYLKLIANKTVFLHINTFNLFFVSVTFAKSD